MYTTRTFTIIQLPVLFLLLRARSGRLHRAGRLLVHSRSVPDPGPGDARDTCMTLRSTSSGVAAADRSDGA
ncbi:hypothetical protein PF005_g19122 [Phytophthora fragariae]|uniref:RxLR effector protein n=1 Tax=Phytophthora fragariae TaxID=53985 RepID=A0A6A3XA66_9STRA|nr:hypothetical protein PF003_g33909 [Phytophthora fragariae]KAE8926503.1 hypothetical protein PF009_g23308 [Phytophthora fragariae]KAE8980371.1 hypothetical protein PF011_g22466 [Phytophthora fragariae]KAE9091308.1 hypothetical protein PF007_g18930 [Phytophthora fragariae]KAE9105702.1 hypothetical protein PF010_g12905 [Phytophthora fragariae]